MCSAFMGTCVLLSQIEDISLLFCTTKELYGHAEMLPFSPKWKYCIVSTEQPTALPETLYFCNILNCIELLFNHPYFQDKIDLTPQHIYRTAEDVVECVYSEWVTGYAAWNMQVCYV